jgi:N-acetylated-alpha-linked acidic dipeptidase
VKTTSLIRWLAMTVFLSCVLVAITISSGAAQESVAIRGFLSSHAGEESQLEKKLLAIPDAARAEADSRRLTSEPHMAGTEASHRVAEWVRDQFASYGFDAEIVPYSVWLPQPREMRLELTAPHKKILGSPEPSLAVDKDTSDTRAIAAFNVYSPSGDVKAPVVYVNYGMQEDYHALDLLGVSVEGKNRYRSLWTRLSRHQG